MTEAIAIDFGTSRTKVAYCNPKKGSALMHFHGNAPYLPSLFYLFPDSDRLLWGHDAEAMQLKDPTGMVDVLKRKMRNPAVRANRRKISPGELLARLLGDLRARAGNEVAVFAGTPPRQVSMTIPALYGPTDERILREAAIQAGFAEGKIELVPEPVAAARAWLTETGEIGKAVVVLDCGGGTIDWAYLRSRGDDFEIVPECPPGGDKAVGGHDIDLELLERVKDLLEGEADGEIEQNPFYYLQQIRNFKEHYCRGLPLYPLTIDGHRVELDEHTIQAILDERFVRQACEGLKGYLEKVGVVSTETLPMVLLVGGSARIKGLKEAIEAQCGCKTVWWEHSEYATVLGAVPYVPTPKAQSVLDRYPIAVEYARFCTQCGSLNSRRLKFCTQCGACLAINFKSCNKCGMKNHGEMAFCTQCGSAL